MDYELVIKSPAENDIVNAIEWYAEISDSLAKKLFNSLDAGLIRIRKNPKHFQKRYGEIRIAFIQKFPYGIYFSIEGHTIIVHAVLHTKQNPDTGIERV